MKRWQSIIGLMLMISAALMAGCIEDSSRGGSRVFTDPLGQEVVLNGTPERIVTLSPALTEIVFALGIGDRVVATDDVSNYPPEAKSLPDVFTYIGLDREKLLSIDPDLVIIDKTLDFSEKAYNSIRAAGIPVYRIYPRTVEDVLGAIEGIGEITGVKNNASALVKDIRERIQAVKDDGAGPGSKRSEVLMVTFYDGTADPWIATNSTFAGSLIRTAGGVNSVSDPTGIVVQVSVETIIGSDPDIILCSQSEVWPTHSRETILSDDAWKDISAIKNGRVYDISGDLVDRTGPRFIEGLEAIHDHIREFTGAE